jgi:group I intron endonuclease
MVIYKTTNLINNKVYIGQDINNNNSYIGSGTILKNAIKKYGKKNFKKEILENCLTKKELDLREQYWINYYNSTNKKIGYNISNGGGGCVGCKHSVESKEKMSISSSGNKNPMFNKSLEDVWRDKGLSEQEISDKKTKWLLNHNTYFRDNNPFKGSKRNGDKNPFFNKNHSVETKKVLSEKANKKKVLQYTIDNEFIKEWESTMEVYKTLKINCRNCCRGLTKTACGYIWKYKNEK